MGGIYLAITPLSSVMDIFESQLYIVGVRRGFDQIYHVIQILLGPICQNLKRRRTGPVLIFIRIATWDKSYPESY